MSLSAQDVYKTLKPLIVALACETGFYVLSIVSFALSTYVLARKGLTTRAALIMWITTFIMLTVSTCHLFLQWVGDMGTILIELGGPSANGVADEVAAIANFYLPIINYSLSDAIVLWRVWIMWERSMKILIFPVLLSLGSTVAAGICIPFGGLIFGLVGVYSSTLATNMIATTLMAVKAWQHRRLIKNHLNSAEYRSQAMSILVLLIESGTLYCVIWIIFLVSWCSIDSKISSMYINETLPGITVQVSGIYPTAVIALAALQKTTWDMSIGQDMSQIAPHTEMRFVTRDTRSGTSTLSIGPTPSIEEGPRAPNIEARDGEV